MPEITINNFTGGVSDSLRQGSLNGSAITKHFDIFSDPKRLLPYKDFEEDQDTTYKITDFLYYGSKIYGYGVVVGSGKVKIYEKANLTASWTASTTGEDSSGARTTNCFVEYKGKIFGFSANARIWSYEVSSNTFAPTALSVSYTNVAQGLVASDDRLYMPYDNYIASNDSGTWNATALTLPTNIVITSIDEYSNYLAIGCRSSDYKNSKIYLWDKTSSDVNEVIDFGEGNLKIIANLDGNLIGISSSTLTSSDATFYRPNVTFRRYNGGNRAVPFKTIFSEDTNVFLGSLRQKKGNVVFFPMSITWNGATHYGIWSLGRRGEGYDYAFTLDQMPDNNTAVTSIDGMFLLGDYWFVALNGDGSVNRTNDAVSYTTTSIFETEKYRVFPQSKLDWVKVDFAPLIAGAQIVLKYRVDEDTSWTTIFTEATDNQISHKSVVVESDGSVLEDFKEVQFRIESTGNAQPTGLTFSVSKKEIQNG